MDKELVDLIVQRGIVLLMDEAFTMLDDGAVAVSGQYIVQVGRAADIMAKYRAKEILDADGGIILPGLINAHTHAAMTLFRGIADDLPLMEWLNDYIFPAETHLSGPVVYDGTSLACAEMIRSGTTCFCDMYLFEQEVARAARDAGVRAVVGEVLYDFPSPNYGQPQEGLRYSEQLIRDWKGHPIIHPAVEPHAVYTCSPAHLEQIMELALRYGVPYVIHLAESPGEIAQVREKFGKTPVRHMDELGLLNDLVVADHSVCLTPEEIEIYCRHRVKVAHCPESNMKLASGVAPVPQMLRAGVVVGLGTDGCASNNNLDLFQEMDTAAKLHKVHAMDPTVMNAPSVLIMATRGGAAALGMEKEIGSLEPGKRADLIVVDTRSPHLTPLYNPCSHLVYAARGADVRHTVINGRVVMRDRQLLTLDEKAVMARSREIAEKIRKAINIKL
jgi:5-methylthioadenosine/S-adenosylhomocysteine deaminase